MNEGFFLIVLIPGSESFNRPPARNSSFQMGSISPFSSFHSQLGKGRTVTLMECVQMNGHLTGDSETEMGNCTDTAFHIAAWCGSQTQLTCYDLRNKYAHFYTEPPTPLLLCYKFHYYSLHMEMTWKKGQHQGSHKCHGSCSHLRFEGTLVWSKAKILLLSLFYFIPRGETQSPCKSPKQQPCVDVNIPNYWEKSSHFNGHQRDSES